MARERLRRSEGFSEFGLRFERFGLMAQISQLGHVRSFGREQVAEHELSADVRVSLDVVPPDTVSASFRLCAGRMVLPV